MQVTISVITVAYNAATDIEQTIQSVLEQTYPHIEYLVLDGASTDNTVNIVKKYETQLKWQSEPDQGLYDAMNKGLQKASGDFVLFMNAGDVFYQNDVLEKVFAQHTPDTDILYGDVMMVSEQGKKLGLRSQLTPHRLPEKLSWKDMRFGMVVSHQAFIARRSIVPAYIENNLCADIDWVIQCLKKSKKTLNTKTVIAGFQTGGLSRQRHRESLEDRYRVLQQHFGGRENFYNHLWIGLRAGWFKLSRKRQQRY